MGWSDSYSRRVHRAYNIEMADKLADAARASERKRMALADKNTKRPTDKELMDSILDRLSLSAGASGTVNADLIAYAQLRALDRLADNVHVLNETLSVIRADLVKRDTEIVIDTGNLLAGREI